MIERKAAAVQDILEGRSWPGVVDWTGRLSLAQLAALLQQANVFVGADSGPAHLAAAVSAPVVALFSGTNLAEQWRPWGEHVSVVRQAVACGPCHRSMCPLADHPCMQGLLPSAALAAIVPRLNTSGPARQGGEAPQPLSTAAAVTLVS